MSATNGILAVTPEAAKWRDLSPQEKVQEKWIRIAWIASALILAVGIAIAIYFCCTITGAGGMSNAAWSLFPSIFGGMGLIPLIVIPILYNKEIRKNGGREDLSSEVNRDASMTRLSTGTLKNVHTHYYEAHGGLGPLVRKGILSVQEGDHLRTIFAHAAPHFDLMAEYDGSSILATAIQERLATVDGYQETQRQIQILTLEFQKMQRVLTERYQLTTD